jgi:hypothetical protein
VPEPSLVEMEIAIEKLKNYKIPGTDQIQVELIKAGGETLCSEVNKLICPSWNKKILPQQWKELESPYYQLPTKFYPLSFWPG